MNPQTWTRLTRQTPLVKVFHYDEITSTSDRARAYLRRKRTPLTGPVLFAADRQTAGLRRKLKNMPMLTWCTRRILKRFHYRKPVKKG